MGANTYYAIGFGATAKLALDSAKSMNPELQNEKVKIKLCRSKCPDEYARKHVNNFDENSEVTGCIKVGNEKFLFFGWVRR